MERSKKTGEVLHVGAFQVGAVTHTMQLLAKFRV